MIGLDTNVLVRIAINDTSDPTSAAQTLAARTRVSWLTPSQPGFVTHIVVVELWWVLTRVYRYSAIDTAAFIAQLCDADCLLVQDREAVTTAIAAVRDHQADFPDALIVAVSRANDCPTVETFDQDAIKLAGMVPIEDRQ